MDKRIQKVHVTREEFIRKIISGKEIVIVGEVKLRLEGEKEEDGRNIFEDLEEKVNVVRTLYNLHSGKDIINS